jgi:asparagine synthase (glutamine-hydrolysing)
MCGVTGFLNFDGAPASVEIVRGMAETLRHRGPDGQGVYVDGPVALGHRRLAIIDLTDAAKQPMVSNDGDLVVSYNGEIYNFRELRTELKRFGHVFRSRSDTEVLLTAWRQWGPAALDRFNGMFAFALWDSAARRLHLCRDRYGIKPLYYAEVGHALLFGSEVKALIAHGSLQTKLDLPALLEYMTFQNFFTDRTLFAGVQLLPAGCRMEIDPQGQKRLYRYWDYDFREPKNPMQHAEYVEELDWLFCQAVKRQLVSDVSVATYLSGGIDSGSITAVAAKEVPNLRTFTIGFDMSSASGLELQMDERRAAEHMSYIFGTEHYQMVLKAGDMVRCLPRMARHIEEPRVGQSYPNFYASHLVSRFDRVVLAGTGGDELFGGYPWRYYRANENTDFEHYIDNYYQRWHRIIPNKDIRKVFAPVWNEVSHVWTRDIFRDVFGKRSEELSTPEDYINHSLYFESKTFLHGLLVVEDKLSMAHSLETRVPFLDNDLVDFAMRVPVHCKLGNLGQTEPLNENEFGPKQERYFQRTRDGKLVLREVLSRYVPKDISSREKQGFSAPDASWFRGESMEYVRKKLYSDDALIYQVLDKSAVQGLVNEHFEGRTNRRLLIWSLLSVEHWMDCFQKSPALASDLVH